MKIEFEKKKKKEQRLGQFIWNALSQAGCWESPEANYLFFIEDKEFLEALDRYSNKYLK